MRSIHISFIPHNEQRYPTPGDYFFDEQGLQFKISQMKDPRYEFLVLVHEFIEWFLIDRAKIKISDIDEFDIEYERNRKPDDFSEPGNDPRSPYYEQHQIATIVERMLAFFLGVDWNEYDKYVNEL